MWIPHPHPRMLLHPNPLFLGFHHSQPLLGAVLGFQLHPSLLSEQEGGGDEQNPAAAAAAHPILGNQSREKIHIPCGPPSSKFFFFFFPPRDSQAVQNIRKNNFHLSRGEPGSRRCSPGWIFQQGFASSQIRSEGMRGTIPNFFPQKCRRGLGVCWWRLDFPRDHRWEMGLECSCGVLGTPNPSSALRIGISSVPSAWGWIWEPKSKLRGLKTPKS